MVEITIEDGTTFENVTFTAPNNIAHLVRIVDNPNRKKIYVAIQEIPKRVLIFDDAGYDSVGEWEKSDIYDRTKKIIEGDKVPTDPVA